MLSDYEIEKLAKMYSVSREVVMRKFLNHGVITSAQYEEKREEYNKEYFKFTNEGQKKGKSSGNYYRTQLTYKGKHYVELAFNGYYAQKFPITQLAQYMGMKISSMQSLVSQKGWGAL